jgi:hypothetical protein
MRFGSYALKEGKDNFFRNKTTGIFPEEKQPMA